MEQEIIDEIGMANLPLIVHKFHEKYRGKVSFIKIDNDCMIRYGNRNIANMSYLATHLHFLDIQNNILTLEGNVSIPYVYRNFCRFYVYINGRKVKVSFSDIGLDEFYNGKKYELKSAFKVKYPLKKDEHLDITFKISTKGILSTCNKINSLRFMPAADVLSKQYAHIENYLVRIRKNHLLMDKALPADAALAEKEFVTEIKEHADNKDEIISLRSNYFERREKPHKRIWLFFDRIDKADDNGEILFKYAKEHAPKDVECFFIKQLDKAKYIIPAFSFRHKELLLSAEYIFTSQMNGFVEDPFEGDVEYFRDIYHRPKVIFLQHGVTKDDQSNWLHKFNHNMYSIIVSSTAEQREFLRPEYGLKKEQIWLTGMPRYDRLYHNEKGQIVIMPTWRKSLMYLKKEENISVWSANDKFYKSSYIKKYKSLLNSSVLKLLCDKYGYSCAFVPHPLCKKYEHYFAAPDWINRYSYDTSYRDIFAESDVMITDYSSVAFDFAYLRKPILYYQFDEAEFFKSHTYAKGYFNYKKNGFGPICTDENQLLHELKLYLIRSCCMRKKEKKKVDSFFDCDITNSCEKILKKVRRSQMRV